MILSIAISVYMIYEALYCFKRRGVELLQYLRPDF